MLLLMCFSLNPKSLNPKGFAVLKGSWDLVRNPKVPLKGSFKGSIKGFYKGDHGT